MLVEYPQAIKTEELDIDSELPAAGTSSTVEKEKLGFIWCYICSPAVQMANRRCLNKHLAHVHQDWNLFFCSECNLKMSTIRMYNRHLAQHDITRRQFKCDVCSMRFAKRGVKLYHEAAVHGIDNGFARKRYACPICDKSFTYGYALKVHTFKVHQITDDGFRCCKCSNNVCSTKKGLWAHERRWHNEVESTLECCLCKDETKLENEDSLRQHLETTHALIDSFVCEYCKFPSATIWDLNQHVSIHTFRPAEAYTVSKKIELQSYPEPKSPEQASDLPENDVVSEEASQENSRDEEMISEPADHGEDNTIIRDRFSCSDCDKKFMYQYLLNLHKLRVHRVKSGSFPCSKCDKVFFLERRLRVHERKYHLEAEAPTLRCFLCTTKTKLGNTNSLKQHLTTTHSHEKLICQHCDVISATTWDLNQHLSIHNFAFPSGNPPGNEESGETPDPPDPREISKCYVCAPAQLFENVIDLNAHLQTVHVGSGAYPKGCAECKLKFKNVRMCNQHLARHDLTVRHYKCSACSLGFYTRALKRSHESLKHGIW